MGAPTKSRTLVFAAFNCGEIPLHTDGSVRLKRQRSVQQIANGPDPIRDTERNARRPVAPPSRAELGYFLEISSCCERGQFSNR